MTSNTIVNNNNNKEITDTYPNNFKPSGKGYEYLQLDQNHETLRLRVTFFINKDRLNIIQQIVDLKYNGFFSLFLDEAIDNLVKSDLNSPESIARDLCKYLLKRWTLNVDDKLSLQSPVQ